MSDQTAQKKLTDFKVLCFDVYGTLIDQEHGTLDALKPLLSKLPNLKLSSAETLEKFHSLESEQESTLPGTKYSIILSNAHRELAEALSGISGDDYTPTDSENETFGQCVKNWKAFPDTVPALRELQSLGLKLVVLSNTEWELFKATNANKDALYGIKLDGIYLAEDIKSYKPSQKNFEYMLEHVQEELGIGKDEVLIVAHGLFTDHAIANEKLGMTSAWIARNGGPRPNAPKEKHPHYDWEFETMGDFLEAYKAELGA